MKYCKNCGTSNSADAEFCVNCGERIETIAEVVTPEVFSASGTNVKERSIVTAIILSLITCGIYSIYWMIKVNDEALELSNEKGSSGLMVFLLDLVTCGIYGYFWAYKMGTCTDKMKGVQNGNSNILYLVIALLGLNIVNMALIQDAINNKAN